MEISSYYEKYTVSELEVVHVVLNHTLLYILFKKHAQHMIPFIGTFWRQSYAPYCSFIF